MPRIYLIRHGETKLNNPDQERIRAWLDVELDKSGIEDAQEAAEFLVGSGIKTVLASDLKRTMRTGKIIADKIGAKLVPTFGARTWNLGALTGQLVKVVEPVLNFFLTHPGSKVPNGESYDDFYNRWCRVLEEAEKYILQKPTYPLGIVTHHSNLLAIEAHVKGTHPKSAHHGPPKPGGILLLYHNGREFDWEELK